MVDAATKRQALRRMELLERANRFVVEQGLMQFNTESELAMALSSFAVREIANAFALASEDARREKMKPR